MPPRRPTRPRGSGTPGRPCPDCAPSRRLPSGLAAASTTAARSRTSCSSRTTTSPASRSRTRCSGRQARWPARTVEVECDRPEQVEEAIAAGAGLVMLDNMTPEGVERCVALVAGRALVEVSGGVTPRHDRGLRRRRGRPHLDQRHHAVGAGARRRTGLGTEGCVTATVVVRGVGRASARPDRAVLVFELGHTAPSPQEALQEVAARTAALAAVLQRARRVGR